MQRGVRGLGDGGEPDTDVERRLPRLASDVAGVVAGRAGSALGNGASGGGAPGKGAPGVGRDPAPSLAERTLADRATHRDIRPGGRLDRLADLVAERQRVTRLRAENGHARAALDRVQGRTARAARAAQVRAHQANRAFTDALGRVYADPVAAGQRFDGLANREGPEAAARAMAERPERFGSLRTAETRRAFGLAKRPTTDAARAGAAEAGRLGATYAHARRAHASAAGRSETVRTSGGQASADPVARAVGVRVERTERSVGGADRGATGRRLKELDGRIARAARLIGRTPLSPSEGTSRGASRGGPGRAGKRFATGVTGRSKRALAARVGTVGVRVVTGIVRATGRGLGRE